MPIVIRDTVLVDIDHVLSNAFWRDPMQGTVSWDEYHIAGKDDEPLHDMVRFINAIQDKFTVIGFTARPERYRKQTMEWCVKWCVNLDDILMRPDDNYRPAPEIKLELATKHFRCGSDRLKHHIAAVFDDREDVVAMFKGLGVTALQVQSRRE